MTIVEMKQQCMLLTYSGAANANDFDWDSLDVFDVDEELNKSADDFDWDSL